MPGKPWEQWEDLLLEALWPQRREAVVMVLTGRSAYAIGMRARIKHLHRRDCEPRVHYNAVTAAADGKEWVPVKCCEPTDAPIGSLAKIDVLRNRLVNGEPLWHEDDNKCAVNWERNHTWEDEL